MCFYKQKESPMPQKLFLNSYLLSIVDGAWSSQTALGWYKTLIADKYNSIAPGQKKRGRPSVSPEDEATIISLAQANHSWGYKRIQNDLSTSGNRGLVHDRETRHEQIRFFPEL